jgi:hypothetical protein
MKLAILCLALAACTPSLMWRGHTPDRRRQAEVIEQAGGQQLVRVGGREGKAYDAIGTALLTFSADGQHIAYPARRGKGWLVVLDDAEGPAWDGIGELRFAPDGGLVYAAERNARWRVVENGVEDPPVDALLKDSLQFSSNGRLAYAIEDGNERRVIADRKPQPPYDGIGRLSFNASGEHLAYVARLADAVLLIRDGVESPPWEAIRDYALAPKGERFAYLARMGKEWFAVVDGRQEGAHASVEHLVISDDGQHVAYVARDAPGAFVIDDGAAGPPFDDIKTTTVRYLADGTLAYVARRTGHDVVMLGGEGKTDAFDEVLSLVVSADGSHWAGVARRGKSFVVLVDGKIQGGYEWAGNVVLSADGSHRAYLARLDNRFFVVHDRKLSPFDVVIDGSLVLTPDGNHWACVAGDARTKRLSIVVQGMTPKPLEFAELVDAVGLVSPERLSRGDLPPIVHQWVEAELASSY